MQISDKQGPNKYMVSHLPAGMVFFHCGGYYLKLMQDSHTAVKASTSYLRQCINLGTGVVVEFDAYTMVTECPDAILYPVPPETT